MRFLKLIVFIGALVAIAALGKQFYPKDASEVAQNKSPEAAEVSPATAEMAGKYDDSVRTALGEFSASYRAADATARRSLAESVQQKLLALTVPVERKDIHLELILATNQMAKGEAAGEKRFSEAVKANAWIGNASIL